MEAPETRYVERPDGVSIAYQVFGSGPPLIYVPGFISHLDLMWSEPAFSTFMRRLARFARVITFDKPGTGLSDPIAHVPALEERSDDIGVVLDAAGCEKAIAMGFSEGVSSCVLFAATRPERVVSLVLYGGLFKGSPSPDELEAWGLPADLVERKSAQMDAAVREWGRGRTIELLCPSLTSTTERRFWGLFERAAASPRLARALIESARRIDVTAAAPLVQAPTLLIHNVDDFVPVVNSRIAADMMPNARLIEFPGADHAFWMSDPEPVLGEIEEFVTGARHARDVDRVLATVLFSDVVGSTEMAADLGDKRWRDELERHDRLVRTTIQGAGGRVVKAMGDGHLSLFDGPARAVGAALTLRESSDLPLRAGLHTGECELMADDVGGLAVHIGARVGALAQRGEVLVSSTVKDLVVGSPLSFADRGTHELKGVPGTWRLYAAGPADAPPRVDHERDLRAADRIALRVARRTPETVRGAAKLARRLSRPRA